MCGRYTLSADPTVLQEELGLDVPPHFAPRYNLAPTQEGLIITAQLPTRAVPARWGLIPSWASDHKIGSQLINAREETIDEKPAYREAFAQRRCLVPADGFYEWAQGQPVAIAMPERKVFTFAGLWETWLAPNQTQLVTFTIITTSASADLSKYHHRMPVLIAAQDRAAWLAGDATTAKGLLTAWRGTPLEVKEVGDTVGNVANDGPECLAPPTRRQLSLF